MKKTAFLLVIFMGSAFFGCGNRYADKPLRGFTVKEVRMTVFEIEQYKKGMGRVVK